MHIKRTSVMTAMGGALLAAVLSVNSVATAEIVGNPLVVVALTDTGLTSSWVVRPQDGTWSPDGMNWHYNNPNTVQLWSQGQLLGSISDISMSLIGDPQVNLNFSVQSGAVNTTFTIASALLTFPPINNATAQASAGVSVTDNNGDGVQLTGLQGGMAYRADYNGLVPSGTNYASLISGVSAGSLSSNTGSGSVGPNTIPGNSSDMSSMWNFSLSPFDIASGTSTYQIVPSPSGLALLCVGLIGLRRRR
jgi:hypothetical protein